MAAASWSTVTLEQQQPAVTASSGNAQKQSDPFDDIFLSENRAERIGFEEGYSDGREKGLTDGYTTGYEKGRQIGEELGFYLGFGETWLAILSQEKENQREKLSKQLGSFISLIKQFPISDVNNSQYTDTLQLIRAQHRQIMSLLKLKLRVETTTEQRNSLTF